MQNEPTIMGEYDIFGTTLISQTKHQKNMDVVCDECKRPIAASRFAPHLEKCMGMGRSSSRYVFIIVHDSLYSKLFIGLMKHISKTCDYIKLEFCISFWK